MWKKLSYCILLVFPMLLLLQPSLSTVKADSQSGYYDITLTTNNNGGDGNGSGTTDPGGNGNGSSTNNGGDQTTNGNNGGTSQTTKAPGSTTASSQPQSVLSGLLPQTNNAQQGLLLGILVLIIALFTWVVYLLIEGKRRGNTNEKIN